ncbi:MAG: hypothetical protein CYG60_13110 [Actinobacteria bacterium]|nr:MAG: hypothetical protein CYG60_13110 [Actinomycetota bacterium]
MPRACTVCRHDRRHDVEVALVRRDALRDIARRFSVSKDALSRHAKEHLPDRLLKAQEHEDVREALDVVAQLKLINEASLTILKEARDEGEPGTALRAIDRIQRQIELQAKLLGNLDERPAVNLYISTEWLELRAVIVSALEPHPDARNSVLRALEGTASGNA